MEKFDVIILGGGACGCMCGLAYEKNKKVLIIDKELKPAKKILATGNGRCNITNTNMSSIFFNQNIDHFLNLFSSNDTISFFKNLGLSTYADSEGRFYPLSNSAKSVVDIINLAIQEKHIDYLGGCEIENVSKDKNFIVSTNKGVFSSKKLVFALGGKSICLAKKWFDEDIKFPCPSLVSLKINNSRALAGVKISDCVVSLIAENGKIYHDKGEVLFKENAISGICIFNLSSHLARQNKFKGKISIDIFPKLSIEEIINIIKNRPQTRKISQIFDGFLYPAIGYEILNRLKLNEEDEISQLPNNKILELAKIIKNFEFEIKGVCDNNQVYAGGVKLSALTNSLESKKTKDLYFGGEACDVDGICGGYNLQWAWTSGKIIGSAL